MVLIICVVFMSYKDAVEDGVPIRIDCYGFEAYFPPCKYCGAPVRNWSYVRGKNYACPACREIAVAQERMANETVHLSEKEKRLSNAVKRISKVVDISKYTDAIEKVKTSLNRRGCFQSTEEVMVCLELLRRGVNFRHQVKILDYKADFVLQDLKVVLEIDGSPFHRRENADQQRKRDELIIWKLGEQWDIIHIKTDNINTNVTRLMPAINALLNKRRNKQLHNNW